TAGRSPETLAQPPPHLRPDATRAGLLAAARGRSGGSPFWCRQRLPGLPVRIGWPHALRSPASQTPAGDVRPATSPNYRDRRVGCYLGLTVWWPRWDRPGRVEPLITPSG